MAKMRIPGTDKNMDQLKLLYIAAENVNHITTWKTIWCYLQRYVYITYVLNSTFYISNILKITQHPPKVR